MNTLPCPTCRNELEQIPTQMIHEAEGATGGSFLFQVALQEFAGDGRNVERPEIGDEVFADAVPGGGRGGELPFPAAQREKHVANPIRHGPGAGDRLSGMEIDGLEQCSHFGQSFGTAHGGAGSENLSAAAVVLPPERDPVPASRRFALLKTTALETAAVA